ncbi:imidazole glycerol phosphate synthase subunit HisH [Rhabdothermincola salaria]|uniref:imidazole glycerol phosphate synthase subunit HisH n=1 Tax=Rhabdothermincola salaria TaxID=2903142 RepID=UPI001E5DA135|nr:imidazole glycerol phosphate synthase subunit HisH [Rhabdothermincola salaria]
MNATGGRPLVAVLDYGIGNLRSAQKALERVGADARLTADPGLVADADAVVLPGVGAFGACMTALHATGLDEVAVRAAGSGRPFLGICVGMQLLYEGSDESPAVPGLGVLPGTLRRLPDGVKRPQMQWNTLDVRGPSAMFAPLTDPIWMYFVHSYAAPADAPGVVATCDYGGPVAAAVELDDVWATQFHPEKSGTTGLELLAGFVRTAAAATGATTDTEVP